MTLPITLAGVLHAEGDFRTRTWESLKPGVVASWVYRNGDAGPASAFLKYEPGAAIPWHWHPAYEHILVLEGSQDDENGHYTAGSILISPPGSSHAVRSDEGCVILAFWERPVQFVAPGPAGG